MSYKHDGICIVSQNSVSKKKTSAYVTEFLAREGLEADTGIAGYCVTGMMHGKKSGPTLMIRSELDELPVTEKIELSFASIHKGVMHACGHDAGCRGCHITGEAKPMIDAGVLENPTINFSADCYLWPNVPSGSIGVKSGPLMAAMDRFDLKIFGKG